ncbi:hypothetical protein DM01DRAFT_1206740 [Hesseltinella vesiculosa]|uniref:Chromo domain-containing protein n=1 Tax=Hesseltinella vesiculosa TaxID=101127 RepID=A0A1X2GPM6_9FUNG|nr:hypothetical protein DM01DRAFT_1206740 [Hesseltinella vesiculosa]
MLISSDPDDTDDDQNYEVEAIVKHRHDEAGRLEYRIKWKGFETCKDHPIQPQFVDAYFFFLNSSASSSSDRYESNILKSVSAILSW